MFQGVQQGIMLVLWLQSPGDYSSGSGMFGTPNSTDAVLRKPKLLLYCLLTASRSSVRAEVYLLS